MSAIWAPTPESTVPANEAAIGVWIPIDPDRAMAAPQTRPMGRAALAMRDEGLLVVFGDRFDGDRFVGVVAEPGGWRPVACSVSAIQDRFPSQSRAQRWAALHARAHTLGCTVGNGRQLTELCRDKVRCQHALEAHSQIRLPLQEARPERFAAALHRWGGAFAKPRYGALGTGVRFMQPGEPVPPCLPSVVDGAEDPTLLQWPVRPSPRWAGRVLRVLAQRTFGSPDEDGWHLLPPVLRQSRADRVVNAARGAQVLPAEDVLSPVVLDEVRAMVLRVCTTLAATPDPGGLALELGVDLALDGALRPWVLEVNSRPRGRLAVLARRHPERFEPAHRAAMTRPWKTLAGWTP